MSPDKARQFKVVYISIYCSVLFWFFLFVSVCLFVCFQFFFYFSLGGGRGGGGNAISMKPLSLFFMLLFKLNKIISC